MSGPPCKAVICSRTAAAQLKIIGQLIESGHIKDDRTIKAVQDCLDVVLDETHTLIERIAMEI